MAAVAYAKVIATGGDAPEQQLWVRASWPAVGEYPDWIEPGPQAVIEMPLAGDFVEVREDPNEPRRYRWYGTDHQTRRLPAAVVAAGAAVAAILGPSRRAYLVVDDREGTDGALRIIAWGAHIYVRNDGVEIEVEATTEIRLGATAAQKVVLGDNFKTLINGHKHIVPTGISGPMLDAAGIAAPFDNAAGAAYPHLSTKVKAEA